MIADHPWIAKQQRLTFARAGKTRPTSLEDYEATGGWKGLERAKQIGPEATVEEVLQSGLRGRGGAGFPTGIKWKTVAGAKADQKYIVCNADEGDSATFADRMVMEGDPFMLIEGMAIAGVCVGATKGYIYCRSEYPFAIAALNTAIERAYRAGMLGEAGVRGLMTIALMGAGADEARAVFASLRELRDRLEQAAGIGLPELSMGMTADAEAAAAEGATLVRIGTGLFGPRAA